MLNLTNRRYTGSKQKLADWLIERISYHCTGDSFLEIFAGTSVVTSLIAPKMRKIMLNDNLQASKVIYTAFYLAEEYDSEKLANFRQKVVESANLPSGYFTENYGGKYFSVNDCKKIEFIRNLLETERSRFSAKEYAILLTSLIYSMDKCANTVGHFDAYIKTAEIADKFHFDLIKPLNFPNTAVEIYNEDANQLAKKITADIVYIDPPYNSRQYCQFYHIYETLVRWDNPELFGVALKPQARLLSEYCRTKAPAVFADLINSLKCRYIAVSYNNTYQSKSKSSRNKITLEEIESILTKKGNLQTFSKPHKFFNAGKTEFDNHLEYLFIVEVK